MAITGADIMLTYYNEAVHGALIWQAARAKWWIIVTSVLYSLASAVMIFYAIQTSPWAFAPVSVFVAFFLWRIYEVHVPVVLATEEWLLVAHGLVWERRGNAFRVRREYWAVSYKDITGFSHGWTEMYVGAYAEGGLAGISVPFMLLSAKNKQKLVSVIEEKQGIK